MTTDDLRELAKEFAADDDCDLDVELLHEFALNVRDFMLVRFQMELGGLEVATSRRKQFEGLRDLQGRISRILRDDDKPFG